MATRPPVPTDVVVVFLAYDGVWQPKIWKLWLEKAVQLPEYSKLHLMVHAPEETKKEGSFEKEYDINRFSEGDPIRFERTGWCEMSIVTETLKAFQKAYLHMAAAATPDAQVHYYLVSGACIPVKPVRLFFRTPYVTILRMFSNTTLTHSQWSAFTHPAIQYLLDVSIQPGRTLKGNNDLSDLFAETVLAFNSWYGLKKYCPDEYVIGNLLYPFLKKERFFPKDLFTIHQWKVHSGNTMWDSICCDASPITWKNANKTYDIRDLGSGFTLNRYGVNDELYASLSTLLLYSRMYPNLDLKASRVLFPLGFFMRKISRALPFKSIRKVLELIYSNEPNIEAVSAMFEKQRKKDLTRPRGKYDETLREETTLPKPPSLSNTDNDVVSLFSEDTILLDAIKRAFINEEFRPARSLFYQPLRDAGFKITRMEDTMTKDDPRSNKNAVFQEMIDKAMQHHQMGQQGRGRQRRHQRQRVWITA